MSKVSKRAWDAEVALPGFYIMDPNVFKGRLNIAREDSSNPSWPRVTDIGAQYSARPEVIKTCCTMFSSESAMLCRGIDERGPHHSDTAKHMLVTPNLDGQSRSAPGLESLLSKIAGFSVACITL